MTYSRQEQRRQAAELEARRNAFAGQYRLVEACRNVHPLRVLGKRPSYNTNPGMGYGWELWNDHATLWRVPGRRVPVLWQSQPYNWTEHAKAEVDGYCEEHGLHGGVTDDPAVCWYYPGAVVSVFIWADEALVPEALWCLLRARKGANLARTRGG